MPSKAYRAKRMPRTCRVCEVVDPISLIELDTLMGDPTRWPATIWGQFKPPSGSLPASYQRFGAIEMGMDWLDKQGVLGLERPDVRRHYRFDVPKIGTNPDQLVANGLIVAGGRKEVADLAAIDPVAYVRYYAEGIEVGIEGLRVLQDKIAKLQSRNIEVPLQLLKMAIDVGARLATSQAAIRAGGRTWGDAEDEGDGFRSGSAPLPSERVGHHRIRTVDGEQRPVVDEGPADREAYSKRAAQEGGVGLPHR